MSGFAHGRLKTQICQSFNYKRRLLESVGKIMSGVLKDDKKALVLLLEKLLLTSRHHFVEKKKSPHLERFKRRRGNYNLSQGKTKTTL